MTQEEIKSTLQPLLKAIQKAEQEYAEAKALIKTAIAKPYMNKPCRITKGNFEDKEGRIIGEDAHYYPIEYLEVFLEK